MNPIHWGRPWIYYMYWTKRSTSLLPSIFLQVQIWGCFFDNKFTILQIAFTDFTASILAINSMLMSDHLWSGTDKNLWTPCFLNLDLCNACICRSSKRISKQSCECWANNNANVTVHSYYQFVNGLHKRICDVNDRDKDVRHDNQWHKGGLGRVTWY